MTPFEPATSKYSAARKGGKLVCEFVTDLPAPASYPCSSEKPTSRAPSVGADSQEPELRQNLAGSFNLSAWRNKTLRHASADQTAAKAGDMKQVNMSCRVQFSAALTYSPSRGQGSEHSVVPRVLAQTVLPDVNAPIGTALVAGHCPCGSELPHVTLPAVPVLAQSDGIAEKLRSRLSREAKAESDREAQCKQSGNVPGTESPVIERATGSIAAAGNYF